jgi:hypothetical protein
MPKDLDADLSERVLQRIAASQSQGVSKSELIAQSSGIVSRRFFLGLREVLPALPRRR